MHLDIELLIRPRVPRVPHLFFPPLPPRHSDAADTLHLLSGSARNAREPISQPFCGRHLAESLVTYRVSRALKNCGPTRYGWRWTGADQEYPHCGSWTFADLCGPFVGIGENRNIHEWNSGNSGNSVSPHTPSTTNQIYCLLLKLRAELLIEPRMELKHLLETAF